METSESKFANLQFSEELLVGVGVGEDKVFGVLDVSLEELGFEGLDFSLAFFSFGRLSTLLSLGRLANITIYIVFF